jgi:hypothetical protein
MGHWVSFLQDVMVLFKSTPMTHKVPINNESETYVVGNEPSLSGRFVRNLCDPVMQALMPLPQMSSVRFADIQALTPSGRIVPDIAFGRVVNQESSPSIDSIYMVGEFKTPWTVNVHDLNINCPNPNRRLETLIGIPLPPGTHIVMQFFPGFSLTTNSYCQSIFAPGLTFFFSSLGQISAQMRMACVGYAFLTTYNFTVKKKKRASDLSFQI